jgi:hypothetical protein
MALAVEMQLPVNALTQTQTSLTDGMADKVAAAQAAADKAAADKAG